MTHDVAPSEQRAVITGVGGALGRALVRQIRQQGHFKRVVGLDRRRLDVDGVEAIVIDLRSADFATIIRPHDTVFHLAAFVHRAATTPDEVADLYEQNHHVTARLAGVCADVGAALIFSSTVAVSSDSAYGRSKALAEQSIRDLGARGLEWSILRFPLLYGPHGAGNMERLLDAIARHRYWPVGDPRTPKSCLFFEDAARALLLAAERGRGETWTTAPPTAPTLGAIHRAAYAAFDRKPPPVAVPRGAAIAMAAAIRGALRLLGRTSRLADQVRTLTAPAASDGTAFADATGFTPSIGLDEGMRRTAEWLKERAVS